MLNVFSNGDGVVDSINKNRMIEAAATAFVRKGYTNTTYSDIGLLLGCSENQIKCVYETKELLFKDVLLDMTDFEPLFRNCIDVLEMLVIIINRMKEEIADKSLRAEIIDLVISSKDIPQICLEALYSNIKNTKLYDAVSRAQQKGIIVNGNTLDTIKQFVVSTYTLIKGYIISGLKIPGNEFFLSIVNYSDEASYVADKALIKQQSSVIAAFASDFQSVLFVDLDNDTADVYQVNGEHDSWISGAVKKGFEEYKRLFTEKFIPAEDRNWFLNEMSADNILKNLEEDVVFEINHKILAHGNITSFQTQIVLDPMYSFGNKILIAGRRIYDK